VEGQRDEHFDDLLDRAAEALCRAPVPPGPPPEAVARVLREISTGNAIPSTIITRINRMKRIARLAAAASVLVAVGLLVTWLTLGGGSTNIAFAKVAEAVDSLRSATYDITGETKGEKEAKSATFSGKGYFLAPSYQRMETSTSKDADKTVGTTTIADGQAGKLLMLMPSVKVAIAMDMKKYQEEMKKSAGKPGANPAGDIFEIMRRLVREGNAGTGEKVEKLGTQQIDGHTAVGFKTHAMGGDMTLWADPETARPVRVEITGGMFPDARAVMSNFCFDADLDPSLFSLEPPAGYTEQSINMASRTEEDLLTTLRTVAEHNKGLFPEKLAMNKEVMAAWFELIEPEVNKIAETFGGKEKLKQMGKQPEFMAELMKTVMPVMQKKMMGITFFLTLKPENDAHYTGGGVKLDTPDRPILWYKPTGSDKYRVIYADLSVKEMSPDEVKNLPEAKPE
jgi:outer membrane lipoprotein-sorting protein